MLMFAALQVGEFLELYLTRPFIFPLMWKSVTIQDTLPASVFPRFHFLPVFPSPWHPSLLLVTSYTIGVAGKLGFMSSTGNIKKKKRFLGVKCGWQPYRNLWADCLDNVGSLTSHNPIGLHGLLRGYLFFYSQLFVPSYIKKLNSVTLVRERTVPRGCCVVSATDRHGRILGFLDRSRYYLFQVAPQLYSRGWADPVPDPLLLRKSASAGNRTRTCGSVARNSVH
jgi:hypothetical protein